MIEHPGVASRFGNPCEVCGAEDEHRWRLQGVRDAVAAGHPVATLCPHPDEAGHGTGCTCDGRSRPDAEAEPDWPKAVADALAGALLHDRALIARAIAPLDDHQIRRLEQASHMLQRECQRRDRGRTRVH